MFVFVYRCRNRCHPPVSSTPSSGSCLDTGIMNGADIVASVAMGARFTLIGRAYLYGLMAGGRQGVDRTIEILSSEIRRDEAARRPLGAAAALRPRCTGPCAIL